VRVIARRTLNQFVESLKGQAGRRAAKAALDAWFHEAQRAQWRNSAEVKRSYGTASIVGGDRVVFNIKGNDYRLVTAIDYRREIVFIKWVGRIGTTTRPKPGRFSMEIKPIRTKSDYERTLWEIERRWDAKQRTPEGDTLDVLATLVEAYEQKHFPIDPPDPIEAIRFRLEQQGLDPRALVGVIGGRSRVYEVMQGKRALSIDMIRRLHERFGIPAEVLIRPIRGRRRHAA
jgi:HTH-type transcriptional regulator/antitoxin HigA